jgi:nascent polypeptide-associated complex subunit alpha
VAQVKINPRQLEKMAKKMGIQSTQIDAEEVIIRTSDTDIVIHNPSVAKVNMMGQETYQVTGESEERSREDFSEEDVEMVAEKAGVSTEEAREALKKFGGIAEAIVGLGEK